MSRGRLAIGHMNDHPGGSFEVWLVKHLHRMTEYKAPSQIELRAWWFCYKLRTLPVTGQNSSDSGRQPEGSVSSSWTLFQNSYPRPFRALQLSWTSERSHGGYALSWALVVNVPKL
jgi:hypothetical protein